jgi:murein DD-endopeptidase MepM/ murein hydrolase activator NlpD
MILFPMPKRKLLTVSVYVAAAALAFFSLFVVAYGVWPELSDSDQPELTLEGVSEGGSYTGVVSVTFTVRDETTSVARVRLRLDGTDIYDRAVGQKSYFDGATFDTASLSEGEHRLLVTVMDGSLWKQLRELTVVFRVDRTPPHLEESLFKASVLEGDTEGVLIRADEKLSSLTVEAFGKKIACYPLAGRENSFRALFAVSQFARPSAYELRCVARDLAGNETSDSLTMKVAAKKFPFETIDLPKSKQGILSDTRRIREDQEKVRAALAAGGGAQLWEGTFIRPVAGIDTSPFGIRRVYNTGGVASSHQGIDIANKEGTPITASNSGVVLLAEELFVDGNAVIIDHGQGVVSYYFHMKALAVKKGDAVAKGALIGFMGTTGLSTGFHCHWQLTVGGQSVNPDEWRENSFEPAD